MEAWNSDIRSWQEILDVLEQAGMIDYKASPELYIAWKVARDTHDVSLLEEVLHRDPWILKEASARVKDFPYFQPKREELYMIQGQFNLGILHLSGAPVGLDSEDFLRGLFICGETGSGKSYPVLRLLDQILSIPKKVK